MNCYHQSIIHYSVLPLTIARRHHREGSLFSSLPLKSRGQLIESEVDPHQNRELNKTPGSASLLSQETSGYYLPTMDFSSLFFSHQLWEAAKWLVTTHGTALPGKKMPRRLVSCMVALEVVNTIFTCAICPCLGCKCPGCTLHVPWGLPSLGREQGTEPARPPLCSLIPKGDHSSTMSQSRRKIRGHKLLLKWGTQRHGYNASEVIAEVAWLWQHIKMHSWLI